MNDEERKQLGLDCIDLIKRKFSGELNREQYTDALLMLHKKYPMNGHNPTLTSFQLKNYKRIMAVYTDPATKIRYLDHLQPWNFEEAAQMYYWHSREDYGREADKEPTIVQLPAEPMREPQGHLDFKERASGERGPGEEE